MRGGQSRRSIATRGFLLLLSPLVLGCQHRPSLPSVAEVRPVDAAQLAAELRLHRGHLLVLNFWATWCEPCIEEFPDLVRSAKRWRPAGVRFISISADDPANLAPVRAMLTRFDAAFDAVFVAAGDEDAMIRQVDAEWPGALPATFLFDRSGRLLHKFLGKIDLDKLNGWILENTQDLNER